MTPLRLAIIASCAALALFHANRVNAADYNAEVTFRMFTATCMRRLGVIAEIQSWAKDARLRPITEPSALSTFVGPGPGAKGGAWVLPSPNDRKFTLSVRDSSQSCAVWAEAGDPVTAESLFRKMVTDAARPGTKVSTDDDVSFTTATGKARLLTMAVTDTGGDGFQFTFMAGDQTGNFFSGAPIQLSLQMSRLQAKKK